MSDPFRRFATFISRIVGTPYAFTFALMVILVWVITGPIFSYSNTWQLVINTFTTILTFLMVFLIQNTQNRDARAMQLKLDELLKAIRGARTSMVNLEELSDADLEVLQEQFRKLQHRYIKKLVTTESVEVDTEPVKKSNQT